MQALHSVFDHD